VVYDESNDTKIADGSSYFIVYNIWHAITDESIYIRFISNYNYVSTLDQIYEVVHPMQVVIEKHLTSSEISTHTLYKNE